MPYTPAPPLETKRLEEFGCVVVLSPVYEMVAFDPPTSVPSVPLVVNGPETARVEVAAVFKVPALPYMRPESDPSTGALVKRFRVPLKVLESTRRVEDAEAPVAESVAPSKERLEPMRSVFTPAAPLPARMPESVVEPVPPYTPERVVVAETTPPTA